MTATPQAERVARCTAGHVEPTAARHKTKCSHRFTEAEADQARAQGKAVGDRCGLPANVPAHIRNPAAAAGLMLRPDDDAELAAAWAAEAPAELEWRRQLAELAEPDCHQCGGPLYWTGAYTALVCPACPAWAVSPDVAARTATHTQAIARRDARSRGEIAERDEAAEAAARAARVRLRGQKEALTQLAEQLAELADPGWQQRGQYQRSAFEVGATLRGYLPEIAAAEDEATLTAIATEIRELSDSALFAELRAERQRMIEHQERQEWAQQQAEDARLRAEAEQAAQRQAEAEERRQARAPVRQPAQRDRRPAANAYVSTVVAFSQMLEAKGQRVKATGACDFKHRIGEMPADRLYGIQAIDWQGQGDGYQVPGTPQVRACHRHFKAADTWLEQTGYTSPEACYWELGT